MNLISFENRVKELKNKDEKHLLKSYNDETDIFLRKYILLQLINKSNSRTEFMSFFPENKQDELKKILQCSLK